MGKQRRSFSVEQKLKIIQEADQYGATQTLRKHNISHSVFLRWKNQLNQGHASSLHTQYDNADPEVQALQEENVRLKRIIGNNAVELEFKTELLKKPRPTNGGSRVLRAYALRSIGIRRLLEWSGLPFSSFYCKRPLFPVSFRLEFSKLRAFYSTVSTK